MIRLIATDIDGTLVKDGSPSCNPEYFPVIEELMKRGVTFVGASGRQYHSIRKMFEPIKDKIWYICEGGSLIRSTGFEKVLAPIGYDILMEMAEEVRRIPGADLMLSTPDYCIVPREGSPMHKWLIEGYGYEIKVCPDWNFPEDENYLKLAVYYPDHADQLATGDFGKKWGRKLHLCIAGTMWLDCIMPGVNKGASLKYIQDRLGIGPEETLVFADNQNDLEMMDQATYTYAVDSARDQVKEAAYGLIPNYERDGELQFLKKLLEDGLTIS